MVQNFEPIFQRGEETRIVVVTSMSGIRPYMYGYSHASAKAGIHHAVRSLTLELSYRYKSVYITEILPGIVDTGLYDSEEVIKSVREIGKTFGFFGENEYNQGNFPLMPPSAVAEAIVLALQSGAHILSINIVAHGQFVNIGA
jgi:short-subunit dehydrogenase